MFNTDHYYEIGYGHTFCQDYALSGSYGNMSYAIVCDGCSGSDQSDVGARLLCHIAERTLQFFYDRNIIENYLSNNDSLDYRLIQEFMVSKLVDTKNILKLDERALFSTLLISVALDTEDGKLPNLVMGWGDGYFIVKKESGLIVAVGNSYSNSAPYYFAYNISKEYRKLYETTFKDQLCQRISKTIDPENPKETVVEFKKIDYSDPFIATFSNEDKVTDIIVTSDGIDTFYKKQGDPEFISQEQTLVDCVNFKNYKGTYVQRRIRNGISKKYLQRDIVHFDDISFAAIRTKK